MSMSFQEANYLLASRHDNIKYGMQWRLKLDDASARASVSAKFLCQSLLSESTQ